ncbi:MAG TPA: hypothetical protein VFR03_19960 [Thermoanaerobaculia bacterium]|nr:hypothetical protein [Thermoanaerobaculia bacterium]
MNRKAVLVVGSMLIAGLAAQAAQAKRWGCWIQADRNVKIRNTTSSASAAVSDWNNLTILNLSSVSSGEETYVFNANSGNTGWGGLATITNYSGCTILRATAQLNTYYSWTTNAARGVHCQEVGHTFGLDHSNDGGCMGGGYWYDIGTHYTIVSANINEIGSMYATRVASQTPEHPVVGPEVDTPRFHAFWINTPHTLGEATRMSSHVVVATAVDVTDGDPIVSVAEAGDEVNHIPTQRVRFEVKRGYKGDLAAGESFILFQNGNNANRFDEDPSYKIGHRYLLFLTDRGDGTYMVIAPEGRYEVTRRGLVPVTEKSFAASLKGISLQDVTADVERAVVEFPER